MEILGGLHIDKLILWGIMLLGGGFILFSLALFCLCIYFVRRKYNQTHGFNCLYWVHPDNSPTGSDYLELRNVLFNKEDFIRDYFYQMGWPYNRKAYEPRGFFRKTESTISLYETRLKNAAEKYEEQKNNFPANSPDWDYKEAWYQLWPVKVKWVYEEKNNGNFVIKPFDPDKIIQDYIKKGYPMIPSSELAEDLSRSQNWMRLFKKPMKLLQTLALGGVAFLGVAGVFGIIILGVFILGEAG